MSQGKWSSLRGVYYYSMHTKPRSLYLLPEKCMDKTKSFSTHRDWGRAERHVNYRCPDSIQGAYMWLGKTEKKQDTKKVTYRVPEYVPHLLTDRPARAVIFVFRSAKKSQNWQKTLSTCFLSSFIKFHSVVPEARTAILVFFLLAHRKYPHKLGGGRLVRVSCHVSANSVQWFQKGRRKCLSQSETGQPSYFSDRQTW